MNTSNTQHLQDDDDERELRRQLGPLRELYRQHTEDAVVNMSIRVHDALQRPRHHQFRSIPFSVAVGLATAITIVVVLNLDSSDSGDQREREQTGTIATTEAVKQDVRVQSISSSRASTESNDVVTNQRDADVGQRTSAVQHVRTPSSAITSTRRDNPKARPRDLIDSEVVLLRDSEMLLAVNEANEDAIVDRILDLDTDEDFAVLDLTSADVDAVLP